MKIKTDIVSRVSNIRISNLFRISYFVFRIYICSTLFLLTIIACSGDPAKEQELISSESVVKEDAAKSDPASNVLVKVNGSSITREELLNSLVAMLGKEQVTLMSNTDLKKGLEALVARRVLAQAAEKELKKTKLEEIERDVQAYREKLLMTQYLKGHANPPAVTEAAITDYYNNNQELFGGKKVREYEMIFAGEKLSGKKRDSMMSELGKVATKKNWKKIVSRLQKKEIPAMYRKGKVNKLIFKGKLLALMESVKKGETSPMTFINGRPYLVRIVEEKEYPPRPLKQVRTQVRRDLAPAQFKKAVAKVTGKLLKEAKLEYVGSI